MALAAAAVALLGLLAPTPASAVKSDRWTGVASMQLPRAQFAAATDSAGRIYAIGGLTSPNSCETCVGQVTNTVERYDPKKRSWTFVAPMNLTRYGHAATTGPDGRIYAIGGSTGTGTIPFSDFTNTVEAYDPATDKWTFVAPMSTPRAGHQAALGFDQRVHALDGFFITTTEAYGPPPTDAWAPGAPVLTPHFNGGGTNDLNGRMYVMGGVGPTSPTDTQPPPGQREVETYGPQPAWTFTTPLNQGRWDLASATDLSNRPYAISGQDGSTLLNSVERFNPVTNTWSFVAPIPTARKGLEAARGGDGRIYALGGGLPDPANTSPAPMYSAVFSKVEAYTP